MTQAQEPYISKHKKPGFTIIELIVVVVVIGILAGISFVSYNGIQARARDTSILSDLDALDGLETNYGLKNNVTGKAWYSGNVTDNGLGFTASSGNVIDVVVNNTDYCIRGYNPAGTKKTINDAFIKESSTGACSQPTLAPSPDVTKTVASVVITGTKEVGETLSTVKNPINATLNYQWRRADPVDGIYSNISNAINPTYKLVSGDLGKYIRVDINGTGEYSGSATSVPTVAIDLEHWIDGVGTLPSTKEVYYQDLPGLYKFGPGYSSCGNLCGTEIDTWLPGWPHLKSPQLYPSLDFSSYPAQTACKNIGGRLPTLDELRSIYTSKTTYNAFVTTSWYLSSALDFVYYDSYAVLGGNNSYSYSGISGSYYVRCIRG